VSEETPGRAAYEAFDAHLGPIDDPGYTGPPLTGWEDVLQRERAAWDAAAQAAIDHVAAKVWPNLIAERDQLREHLAAAVDPTAADYDRAAAELEARDLREKLTTARERLENLAAGLRLSASASRPSKKSEIERGCAEAVRDIAASLPEATS
jgi:hypothetical protein